MKGDNCDLQTLLFHVFKVIFDKQDLNKKFSSLKCSIMPYSHMRFCDIFQSITVIQPNLKYPSDFAGRHHLKILKVSLWFRCIQRIVTRNEIQHMVSLHRINGHLSKHRIPLTIYFITIVKRTLEKHALSFIIISLKSLAGWEFIVSKYCNESNNCHLEMIW